MMLLTVFGGNSNVNTLENNSITPRAIETYTKDYVVGCDDYGYSTTPAVGFVIKGNTIKVEVTVYQFGLQSAKGTVTIYL